MRCRTPRFNPRPHCSHQHVPTLVAVRGQPRLVRWCRAWSPWFRKPVRGNQVSLTLVQLCVLRTSSCNRRQCLVVPGTFSAVWVPTFWELVLEKVRSTRFRDIQPLGIMKSVYSVLSALVPKPKMGTTTVCCQHRLWEHVQGIMFAVCCRHWFREPFVRIC